MPLVHFEFIERNSINVCKIEKLGLDVMKQLLLLIVIKLFDYN